MIKGYLASILAIPILLGAGCATSREKYTFATFSDPDKDSLYERCRIKTYEIIQGRENTGETTIITEAERLAPRLTRKQVEEFNSPDHRIIAVTD